MERQVDDPKSIDILGNISIEMKDILNELVNLKQLIKEIQEENEQLRISLEVLENEFGDVDYRIHIKEIQAILTKIWQEENKDEWFIHKL